MLNKAYCINLETSIDRWKNIETVNINLQKLRNNNLQIEQFKAVNSCNNNINLLQQHKLALKPFNVSVGVYFYYSPRAVGCFLSHYNLWKKIVKDKIPYSLILEDDVDPSSLFNFLKNKKKNSNNFEFIFLSKRVFLNKPYIDFWGAESYILSYEGASKLLKAVENPSVFKEINDFAEDDNVVKYFNSLNINLPKQNLHVHNSIVVPNDRLFTLCCHTKCEETVRLNYNICSCIELHQIHKNSNIIENVASWGANPEQIKQYLNYSNDFIFL